MLHAEQNLCSLFNRGEVKTVALTISPCKSCMALLCAHGVEEVYFRDYYHRCKMSEQIADFYGVIFQQVPGVIQVKQELKIEFTPSDHVPSKE
jgi:dCMP deaminase